VNDLQALMPLLTPAQILARLGIASLAAGRVIVGASATALAASADFTFVSGVVTIAGSVPGAPSAGQVLIGGGAMKCAGAITSTVADAVPGLRIEGATGKVRFRGYVDATNGAIIDANNPAESIYLPLTLQGSSLRLLGNGGAGIVIDAAGGASMGAVVSSGSVAGDYLVKVNNTSGTGKGLRVQPGADGQEALAVRNAAGSTITFYVDGAGNMRAAGTMILDTHLLGYRTTAAMVVSGGTAATNGANLSLTGATASDVAAEVRIDGTTVGKFDDSATADETRFLLWDVTAGSLKRVTRGATDSAGSGFRQLRIAN
jgi:hypothetical protein